MREIKFKAFDTKVGMWIGDFVIYPEGQAYTLDTYGYAQDKFSDRRKYKMHLMQYTGLKDKNGKEIYEGDILNNTYYCSHAVGKKVGAVSFGIGADSDGYNAEQWLGWLAGDSSLYDVCRKAEVIGNIFENPELLEDK